jgi:hypothetical protein
VIVEIKLDDARREERGNVKRKGMSFPGLLITGLKEGGDGRPC